MSETSQTQEEGVRDSPELLQLVQRCGEGDAGALRTFFERFSDDIYNFPLKVFHLDQDSASEFYLYAFERLRDGGRFRSFQGRSSFRTWFYTVLRNLVIDWMRTIRELETVNVTRYDDKGNEYRLVENTADPRSMGDEDAPLRELLGERLDELSVELRSIFKLSFIYYLQLDGDELSYISEKSGRDRIEILERIARLKHRLSEKELKNIASEDKITALYLTILDLKTRRERLLTQPNRIPDPAEIERIDRSIQKKYQQRARLLDKKDRGHFVVRTPYKEISDLMRVPEGSVSVQMMRALDKIRRRRGRRAG